MTGTHVYAVINNISLNISLASYATCAVWHVITFLSFYYWKSRAVKYYVCVNVVIIIVIITRLLIVIYDVTPMMEIINLN